MKKTKFITRINLKTWPIHNYHQWKSIYLENYYENFISPQVAANFPFICPFCIKEKFSLSYMNFLQSVPSTLLILFVLWNHGSLLTFLILNYFSLTTPLSAVIGIVMVVDFLSIPNAHSVLLKFSSIPILNLFFYQSN